MKRGRVKELPEQRETGRGVALSCGKDCAPSFQGTGRWGQEQDAQGAWDAGMLRMGSSDQKMPECAWCSLNHSPLGVATPHTHTQGMQPRHASWCQQHRVMRPTAPPLCSQTTTDAAMATPCGTARVLELLRLEQPTLLLLEGPRLHRRAHGPPDADGRGEQVMCTACAR